MSVKQSRELCSGKHPGLREAQGGKCFLKVVKRLWSLVKVP